MVRYLHGLALVVLLAGGCAGAPQHDEATAPAAAATEPAAVAPSGAPTDSSLQPNLVIDVNDLAARAPAPVICRDTLRQGSNVHVRQCMTEAQWKIYRRVEAEAAGELTRAFQNGRYR